jgi:hypothetical protein
MGRTCPAFSSETQVRLILDTLNRSQEPPEAVAEAKRYLRGVLGSIVRRKKARRGNAEPLDGGRLGRPPMSRGTPQNATPFQPSGASQIPVPVIQLD